MTRKLENTGKPRKKMTRKLENTPVNGIERWRGTVDTKLDTIFFQLKETKDTLGRLANHIENLISEYKRERINVEEKLMSRIGILEHAQTVLNTRFVLFAGAIGLGSGSVGALILQKLMGG